VSNGIWLGKFRIIKPAKTADKPVGFIPNPKLRERLWEVVRFKQHVVRYGHRWVSKKYSN
jgi:hypothetical protein